MEKAAISALVRMDKEICGDRKRTTIVITSDGDTVHVGVKAIARVFERDEKGNIKVYEQQYGDLTALNKDDSVGCLFDRLKELLDKVPEIIDKANPTDVEA